MTEVRVRGGLLKALLRVTPTQSNSYSGPVAFLWNCNQAGLWSFLGPAYIRAGIGDKSATSHFLRAFYYGDHAGLLDKKPR